MLAPAEIAKFSISVAEKKAKLPAFKMLLLGTFAGAFVASIPGRIRRRREPHHSPSKRSCLLAFLGGMLLMLSASLTGADSFHLIGGMMQGSIGALAFLLCAWFSAGITAFAAGRKQS